MLESPEERGKATRFVKELGIHPPKKKGNNAASKKRKIIKGKKRTVDEFTMEEPVIEYVDILENNADSSTKRHYNCSLYQTYERASRCDGPR